MRSPAPRESFPRGVQAALWAAALALIVTLAACAPRGAAGGPAVPKFYPQCWDAVRRLQKEAQALISSTRPVCGGRGLGPAAEALCRELREGGAPEEEPPGASLRLPLPRPAASAAAAILSRPAQGKDQFGRFALYEEAAAEDRETIIRAAGPARLAAECYRRACRDVPGLDAPGLSGMSAKERRKRLLEIQGGAAEAARILEWFIAASEHSAEMFGLALAFEAERERDRLPKARIRKMERTLEENRAAARGAENVLWRLEGVIGLAKEALGSAK